MRAAALLLFVLPSAVPGQQPADSEVAGLIKVLEDPAQDVKAKAEACKKLGQRGKKAVAAVPALLALSSERQLPVPAILTAIGPDAVPALAAGLEHRTPATRRTAARGLGSLHGSYVFPRTRPALPALLKALK